MNGDRGSDALQRDVTIQLLDPSYRRPIKTWRFADRDSITIGRGDEVDVEISDAYVSRVHAELMVRDEQWILVSRGRNGVVVGSQPVNELPVAGEITFRLGSAGPLLRFNTTDAGEANSATLCFAADANPLVRLDETKVRDDVAQITSGDYFQNLQRKAEELRRQRRGG